MAVKSKLIKVAIIFPILAMSLIVAYKSYQLESGKKFTFQVDGYDPRDLLSGHYVMYEVDYGIEINCNRGPNRKKAMVCLSGEYFTFDLTRDCKYKIIGECRRSRFVAGIEKFFIAEEHAKELDAVAREGKASIRVSVLKNGKVGLEALLINGKEWGAK